MSSTWDTSINSWKESVKDEGAYDSIGNLILNSRYTWDTPTNSWKGSYKYETTYDSNGNYTVRMSYAWDSNNNSWTLSDISSYFYSSKNISILTNPTLLNVYLYPNPTNSVLNIMFENTEIKKLEILDLTGKVVFLKNNIDASSENVNVSNFAQGVYLLRYQQKNGIWGSSKFVKN